MATSPLAPDAVEVILLTPSDAAATEALQQLAFRGDEVYGSLFEELGRAAGLALGAVSLDGKLSGYLLARVSGSLMTVESLAVDPRFRRRGVGAKLLSTALEAGRRRGAVTCTLEVRRSNTAARRLYRRLGFRGRGVRASYYQNPDEDGLILWIDDLDAPETWFRLHSCASVQVHRSSAPVDSAEP